MSEDESESTTTAYSDVMTETINYHSNEGDELKTRLMEEKEDCDEDLAKSKANLIIPPKVRKTLR